MGQGSLREVREASVTRLLDQAADGDPRAAAELLPLVYDQLRQLARQKMRQERADHTLQATALVHEVFLRLVNTNPAAAYKWDGRGHFFAAAAEAMRRILVEQARSRGRRKRGGGLQKTSLDSLELTIDEPPEDLLALDEALEEFSKSHALKGQVVKLKYFAGLTTEEAAHALGISLATAERHWAYARAWLSAHQSGSRPMSSDESIFDQALGISSPQERLAFLDRACDGNSPLRNEVEALLAAHERADAFMQSSLIKSASRPEHSRIEPPEDLVGQTVGHYKLLERIGEGGMGVVYMAQQLRPVTRLVALKIIKPGMDSQRVIARFEAERQVLAMMDHINIAKVFDAGATDAGRPYFAMELVRGIPITEHCDCHQLTPRQRLELFLQVCHAVQHAHGKGIIHRDLKPSNVLVTLADGAKPIPKIIDFGIAKATADQRLTDRTLFTEFRQLIGTPLYMSPEQAEGRRQMDIDTRSDVYSLGVLLYELLTGTTPFDKQRLAQAAYDEVRRIICEEDPPKPSMRLSTLGETITSISAQRQSDPRKLSQTVRGELDWIVMKAMEKERTRRYETANGLARDVERYLADQPVEASPPSQFYRVRKTFRRNKAAIATASALVGMLIAATVVSTWQAARATRAKAAADRSAATANQIAKSLQQMLASATSPSANGADYTVPAMLDNLAPTLDYALVDQPEAEAALRTTLGIAYHNLGDANKAAKHLARTVELQRRLSGEQHEKYADALVDYANNLKEQGWYRQWDHRGDADAFFKPAEADLRKALDVYRQRGISGERVMKTLRILNAVLGAEGRGAESEEVARQGLAVAAQSPGVEFWETATFYGALAGARLSEGKIQEAEELNAKSIAIFQRTGHQPDSGGRSPFSGQSDLPSIGSRKRWRQTRRP